MKTLATVVATAIMIFAPASAADAKPEHHHDAPVVSHAIDWD